MGYRSSPLGPFTKHSRGEPWGSQGASFDRSSARGPVASCARAGPTRRAHLRFYADWEKGRRHYSGYRFPATRASLQYLTRSIDSALDIIVNDQLDSPEHYPDAKRQVASLKGLDATVKDLLTKRPT